MPIKSTKPAHAHTTHPHHPKTNTPAKPTANTTTPTPRTTGDTFAPTTVKPVATAIVPGWLGNPTVDITRGPSVPKPLSGPIQYDSWARARAEHRKVNFEVWAPGVTDRENNELWKQLDVQVHFSVNGAPEKTDYVQFAGRAQNNAKYSLDLSKFDPYASNGGPLPTGLPASTDVSFYFTVNGKKLDAAGQNFNAHFTPGY